MKILVAVALLVAIEEWVEAHPNPGFQNVQGHNTGLSHDLPWAQYPQRFENQNNGFSSDVGNVEWICQNPRTNDMMIIASDDTRHTPQQYPNRGPWWQWNNNVPPGHHHPHHPHWTHNQPIVIVQETPNTDNNQTPPPLPTTTEIPNNNNDIQTQSPPYHGGEGSIDIRVGAK